MCERKFKQQNGFMYFLNWQRQQQTAVKTVFITKAYQSLYFSRYFIFIWTICDQSLLTRVGRYQRGHQNSYIEEQTTQWPKEKGQKDKQWSTKHTHKTKDRITRTPLT
jgi:hypothetical protein